MLKMSSWTAWPFEGTWADQPAELVDDVMTWLAIERRLRWEEKRGITADAYKDDGGGPKIKI